ncbi:MAG: hypothetical protein A2817_02210 [Candidatus Yanofskybacteria bacterium RIFCSPHIGHO2_01_FULL_39_8b]|uniref:Uncharacterized protein n=1 Tax=Candidatus Yanofskybacteria bacterium RIFCSPHIGHO2_01_FULL_39_8b TaxID=1802659 RepID=A0A1F8EID3_9BACT|nr:MAG: hypothetical protein A2817_02210 [Candidatus Yanofskybacteria bacterium RIFCSPHIGHO2_01_FULL_39_8b]
MKILSKLTEFVKQYQYNIFLAFCISLVSFISFNLGKINALEKLPIKVGESGSLKTKNTDLKADVYNATTDNQQQTTTNQKKLDIRVVVSKASTSKKYDNTTLLQFIDYVFTIDYKPFRRIKDPETGLFISQLDYNHLA